MHILKVNGAHFSLNTGIVEKTVYSSCKGGRWREGGREEGKEGWKMGYRSKKETKNMDERKEDAFHWEGEKEKKKKD